MSKLFYDHLIDLSDLEKLVKKHVKDREAREEIYALVDEIVHHRVVGSILDRLHTDHHKEFLDHVASGPHDYVVLEYLKERIVEDVEEFIRHEIYVLGTELLEMFAHKGPQVHKS